MLPVPGPSTDPAESSRASAAAPPAPPSIVALLRVSAEDAEPIRSLLYVSGKQESLLVLGGQATEMPDSLSMLPLPEVGVCMHAWSVCVGGGGAGRGV